MHVFYTSELNETMAFLPEQESGHAIRVLRLRRGDKVWITDGKGGWYEGSIEQEHPKRCIVAVHPVSAPYLKQPYRLTMAVAPTKNPERLDWFIEKAVEIGIDVFIPLITSFSERKNINHTRLEKLALAAMKQSMKAWAPEIMPMQKFEETIALPFAGAKFIAHCHAGVKPFLGKLIQPGEDVFILIGPEGDFSTGEVKEAAKNGFLEVSLGHSRLRTETAAMVACHTVALRNEK